MARIEPRSLSEIEDANEFAENAHLIDEMICKFTGRNPKERLVFAVLFGGLIITSAIHSAGDKISSAIRSK